MKPLKSQIKKDAIKLLTNDSVNKNLPKNHIITFDDLESKKPKGFGILALDFHKVIGRKLNKQKSQWDFLNEDDLE
jgi:N-acetylneuraminate synthase